jgi:type II secretory pathway pseudopilin PulG
MSWESAIVLCVIASAVGGLVLLVGIWGLTRGRRKRGHVALAVAGLLVCGLAIATGVVGAVEQAREDEVRRQIRVLDSAIRTYSATTGELPPDLQTLTVPEKAGLYAISDKDLIDPWGKPYAYDPHVQEGGPVGDRMRVSTVTPFGATITNR